MENLNTIPKTGNYGSGVDLHNDNYSKIGLKLETLENMSFNEKGYFETLSALQTKYPTPQSGWQAYVKDAGSSTGYYVANVNSSGDWVVTSAEAPSVGVDLDGYALTGGSEKTVKDVEDEIVQLAGEVESLDNKLKNWILSESYSIQSYITDSYGNITSAQITYPDGIQGSIGSVTFTPEGAISTVLYNYGVPTLKSYTLTVTYINNQIQTSLL